jgi:hypothetical protein
VLPHALAHAAAWTRSAFLFYLNFSGKELSPFSREVINTYFLLSFFPAKNYTFSIVPTCTLCKLVAVL